MSDTQRTLSALIALFPDNNQGLITPQRVRDLLVSLAPSRGGYVILPDNAAETVIASTGTWTNLAGTSTDNTQLTDRLWSTNGSNIKRYDGTVACVAVVQGKVNLTPGEGNTEWSLTIGKNGTPLEQFAASVRFAGPQSGNAATTIPVTAMLDIDPDDTLGLWLRRDDGSGNATAQRAVMSVTGFVE